MEKKKSSPKKILLKVLIFIVVVFGVFYGYMKYTYPSTFRLTKQKPEGNTIYEMIYGKYYSNNDYISDNKNAPFFLKSDDGYQFNEGKLTAKANYNVADFDRKILKIDNDEFFDILKSITYKNSSIDNPDTIKVGKQSNYANCVQSSVFIYEWLKIHYPPAEYKYHLNLLGLKEGDIYNKNHTKIEIKNRNESFIVDYNIDKPTYHTNADPTFKLINVDKLENFINSL